MWTLRNGRVVKKESERCAGLDPQHKNRHDPDLEIDAAEVELDDDEEEEEDGMAWDEDEEHVIVGGDTVPQWQLGALDELD